MAANISSISGYTGIVSSLSSVVSQFAASNLKRLIADHNAVMARYEGELIDIATSQELDILKTQEVRILRDTAKQKSRFLRDTGKEEARLLKQVRDKSAKAIGSSRAIGGASGFSLASGTQLNVEQDILNQASEAEEQIIVDFADAEADMITDLSAGERDLIYDVAVESAAIRSRGNLGKLRAELQAENIELGAEIEQRSDRSRILTSLSEIPQQKSFSNIFSKRRA